MRSAGHRQVSAPPRLQSLSVLEAADAIGVSRNQLVRLVEGGAWQRTAKAGTCESGRAIPWPTGQEKTEAE